MRNFFSPERPESLEIRKRILREIEDRVQPLGDDRWIFPYHIVHIRLRADRREELEGAFQYQHTLESDIRALIRDKQCPIPQGFTVEFEFVDELQPTSPDCEVKFARVNIQSTERPRARLVLLGEGERREYPMELDRVYIGRDEVGVDESGIERRNDIFFPEDPSVSRKHAYIAYRRDTWQFWLYDTGKRRSTFVYRENRPIEVSSGRDGGALLISGDEIRLGRKRLRFEISESGLAGE